MPRPALRVRVSKKDQEALKKVLAGGIEQVRVAMRAVALLRLAEGMGAPRIAEVLPMTRQAVRNLARRYQQGGLERALYDKQRPGAASLLSAKQRQRIIAMPSCDFDDVTWAMEAGRDGSVRAPIIDRILPLHEAAAAHRLVEQRIPVGKVLLDPTQSKDHPAILEG